MNKEAEQWKHECEVLDACLELAQGKIAELKAENERLKARVKEIGEKMSFLNADRCSEIMRYKQTLQEIKEIAERQMRCCTCKLDDYKSGCKECESKYAREIAVEILQKITKAGEE